MTAKLPVETLILSHANVDFDAFAGHARGAAALSRARASACTAASTATCASSTTCTPTRSRASSRRRSTATRVRRLVLVEVSDAGAARRLRASSPARRACRGGRVRPPRRAAARAGDGARRRGRQRRHGHAASCCSSAASRSRRCTRPRSRSASTRTPGSLTYSSTTQRDIEALAACVRAGREPGAARPLPARAAAAGAARAAAAAGSRARSEREVAGLRVVTAAARAPAATSRTSRRSSRASATSPTGTCCCSASRWRDGCWWSGAAAPPRVAIDEALDAARRRRPRAGRLRDRARRGSRRGARARAGGGRARRASRRCARGDVMSRPVHAVASERRDLGHAGRVPAPRPERHPGVRGRRS